MLQLDKLECLSLECLLQRCLKVAGEAGAYLRTERLKGAPLGFGLIRKD
jgi:hypothetical protein